MFCEIPLLGDQIAPAVENYQRELEDGKENSRKAFCLDSSSPHSKHHPLLGGNHTYGAWSWTTYLMHRTKQLPSSKQKPATGMASGSALQTPHPVKLSCREGHQAGRAHLKNPGSPFLQPHIKLPFWSLESSVEVSPNIMISSVLRRKVCNTYFVFARKLRSRESYPDMKFGSLE